MVAAYLLTLKQREGCIYVGVVSEDPPGKFRPPTFTQHVFSSKQFLPWTKLTSHINIYDYYKSLCK
jgi:hypothetical protein